MSSGLKIVRLVNETWRECAHRYGARYGLEIEVLREYDRNISEFKMSEAEAAFDACYEWDICELAFDDDPDEEAN